MHNIYKITTALGLAVFALGGTAQAHERDRNREGHRDAPEVVVVVRGDDRHRGHEGSHHGGGFAREVNRRQASQEARIREGWRQGDLTYGEMRILEKQQDKIAEMERRYKADGHLSGRERRKLDRALDFASMRIYDERHDRRIADGRDGDDRHGHWRVDYHSY